MKGLFVPSSTSPIASMARLSICPFSANFEKSWMKARWIVPSVSFAPLAQAVEIFERAAMNLRAHFFERLGIGVGAGEAHHLVAVGDQFLVVAVPIKPAAPVMNTRMGLSLL
jgi:hypothetical protein